jgi:hypothetical protein
VVWESLGIGKLVRKSYGILPAGKLKYDDSPGTRKHGKSVFFPESIVLGEVVCVGELVAMQDGREDVDSGIEKLGHCLHCVASSFVLNFRVRRRVGLAEVKVVTSSRLHGIFQLFLQLINLSITLLDGHLVVLECALEIYYLVSR